VTRDASASDPTRLAAAAETVEAFELVRVHLPRRRVLDAAHGPGSSVRDVVLVRALGADGHEGWGECSALEAPTYMGEHTDGAWAVLRDHLVPAALRGQAEVVRGHPMATTAVEVALVDLQLRRDSRSLRAAMPVPASSEALAWTAVIGLHGDIAALLAEAASALARGAAGLKLKIQPRWDREPVLAVRAEHPEVALAVDANGSYAVDDDALVGVGEVLAEAGGYVEQPLSADDLLGHAALATRLAVPIALDESITSAGDACAAARLGACGVINVKPARLGGVAATSMLATAIGELDATVRPSTFLGGMLETGVGRSAALAIGELVATRRVTDLGPSCFYFDEDVTDPIEVDDSGRHRRRSEPGLSAHPRPDRLDALAVDRMLLRR
jgi:O-succinylbenzoate synthase